jgi:hypothetical protein
MQLGCARESYGIALLFRSTSVVHVLRAQRRCSSHRQLVLGHMSPNCGRMAGRKGEPLSNRRECQGMMQGRSTLVKLIDLKTCRYRLVSNQVAMLGRVDQSSCPRLFNDVISITQEDRRSCCHLCALIPSVGCFGASSPNGLKLKQINCVGPSVPVTSRRSNHCPPALPPRAPP